MLQLLFQIIFWSALPFVGHPELAFLIAGGLALFLVASLLHTRQLQLAPHLALAGTAALWILFGMNEIHARQQGWDIRVDLLLYWPVVAIATIAAVWSNFRLWRKGAG